MTDTPDKPETPQEPAKPAAEAAPAASSGAPAAGGPTAGGPGGGGARGGGGGRGRGGGPGGGRGQGGGRDRRGGGRRGRKGRDRDEDDGPRYEERVIQINRCATTVKGGRRMSFSAFVAIGDKKGKVSLGFGKAKAVPNAVEKAMKDARRKMGPIALDGTTIPHEVVGRFGSARVILLPASSGTGVIAGAPVRAVLECVGVSDILTKSLGSGNPLNIAKATLAGLKTLRTKAEVEKLRGVSLG